MSWAQYRADGTAQHKSLGSEGGVIIADEVFDDAARITLERDTANRAAAAISCGIYGWMMHTRFFADLEVARNDYEAMKIAISDIVVRLPSAVDPNSEAQFPRISAAIEVFLEKYP